MGLEFGISTLPTTDRIEFFRTLGSWLTSGGGTMPVNEAIRNTCEAFSRDEYKSLAGRMARMTAEYESGQIPFYESLRRSQLGFTKQELSVLEAAERSNQLRLAVPSMVDAMIMRQDATRVLSRRLAMPLIGGFMLILMSLGVALFMLPMVLGPVIQRKPEALDNFPQIIQGYWAFSVWLRANWIVPLAFSVFPLVVFLTRKTPFMRNMIEKFIWGFTPTKRISIAFNGVMAVYFMPALVRSGMPAHDVLRAIAGALDNQIVAGAFRIAANEHEQGLRLGDALARVPLRASFRNAVEAGEKTGKIAERVEDLKIPYTTEYERVTRKAIAALNMIVMALLMPMFIMSMYTSLVAPIFALMEF
jgi:type II secretory pathway component PulF